VDALRQELAAAGARWQLTEFGDAYHAFTDPEANTPHDGRDYHPVADRISWAGAMALIDAMSPP
jgi:dienelactone hydrolase